MNSEFEGRKTSVVGLPQKKDFRGKIIAIFLVPGLYERKVPDFLFEKFGEAIMKFGFKWFLQLFFLMKNMWSPT